MFSIFGKKKPAETRAPHGEDKFGFRRTVRDDLIGVDDWKRSKIGYITGFSSAYRMVSSLGTSILDSRNRLTSLLQVVKLGNDRVESLPASSLDKSFSVKFEEAASLHNRRDADLLVILRNTARNGYFFLFCTALCLAVSILTSFFWPPIGIFAAVIRLGPVPLAAALAFRSLYTNWLIRNRVLCPPIYFIRSKRWLPSTDFEQKKAPD